MSEGFLGPDGEAERAWDPRLVGEHGSSRFARLGARLLQVPLAAVLRGTAVQAYADRAHDDGGEVRAQAHDPLVMAIAERVWSTGKKVVLGDVRRDPDLAGVDRPWEGAAALAIPIICADRAQMGSVVALDNHPRDWSQNHIQDLSDTADLAAEALDHAREHQLVQGLLEHVQNLVAREGQYRQLIEIAFDGILVHVNGVLVYANPAALRLLGARRALQILGRSIGDFLPPPYLPGVAKSIETGAQEGLGEPVVLPLKRVDGTQIEAEIVSVPFGLQDRPAAQVVLRDVTEREQNKERLMEAHKMEALGRLSGGIAHEVNNMVTVILAHTELLSRKLPPKAPGHASVEAIRSSSERAASMARAALAFSRRQVFRLTPANANELVKGLEPLLRGVIGSDIELIMQLSRSHCIVEVDAGQIEQALLNLVLNARDAVKDRKGRITVSVQPAKEKGNYPRELAKGPYVVIAVEDNGPGMDQKTAQQAFEPFFTTKSAGEGTGLGLSIAYGIVLQSGGTLRVDTAPGKGARFEMWLPRVQDEARPSKEQPPSNGEGGDLPARILLVDDEPALRDVMALLLRERGLDVYEAGDGREALACFRRLKPKPDAVVTDLEMPKMNGRELAEELARLAPNVPVLFLSGHTSDEIARRGLLDPEVPFLTKPFTSQELLSWLQTQWAQNRPHPG